MELKYDSFIDRCDDCGCELDEDETFYFIGMYLCDACFGAECMNAVV